MISTVSAISRHLARFIIPSSVHGTQGLIALMMWWAGILLEGAILWRAVQTKLLSRYILFYVYLAAVWFSDIVFFFIYRFAHGAYVRWNWPATFFDGILSLCIVLEVLDHEIPSGRSAGTLGKIGRLIRKVVWGTMASLTIACGLVVTSGGGNGGLSNIQIERYLAGIEAILLLAALGVIFYYAIPVGRNLMGLILGYGLCVGASVMILTLRIYIGSSFNPTWQLAQPFSFWLSLMIWLLTLWNDDGEPVFGWAVMKKETDPFSLAGRVRTWMRSILSIPAQAARP